MFYSCLAIDKKFIHCQKIKTGIHIMHKTHYGHTNGYADKQACCGAQKHLLNAARFPA